MPRGPPVHRWLQLDDARVHCERPYKKGQHIEILLGQERTGVKAVGTVRKVYAGTQHGRKLKLRILYVNKPGQGVNRHDKVKVIGGGAAGQDEADCLRPSRLRMVCTWPKWVYQLFQFATADALREAQALQRWLAGAGEDLLLKGYLDMEDDTKIRVVEYRTEGVWWEQQAVLAVEQLEQVAAPAAERFHNRQCDVVQGQEWFSDSEGAAGAKGLEGAAPEKAGAKPKRPETAGADEEPRGDPPDYASGDEELRSVTCDNGSSEGEFWSEPRDKKSTDGDLGDEPRDDGSADGDLGSEPRDKDRADGDLGSEPRDKESAERSLWREPRDKDSVDGSLWREPRGKGSADGSVWSEPRDKGGADRGWGSEPREPRDKDSAEWPSAFRSEPRDKDSAGWPSAFRSEPRAKESAYADLFGDPAESKSAEASAADLRSGPGPSTGDPGPEGPAPPPWCVESLVAEALYRETTGKSPTGRAQRQELEAKFAEREELLRLEYEERLEAEKRQLRERVSAREAELRRPLLQAEQELLDARQEARHQKRCCDELQDEKRAAKRHKEQLESENEKLRAALAAADRYNKRVTADGCRTSEALVQSLVQQFGALASQRLDDAREQHLEHAVEFEDLVRERALTGRLSLADDARLSIADSGAEDAQAAGAGLAIEDRSYAEGEAGCRSFEGAGLAIEDRTSAEGASPSASAGDFEPPCVAEPSAWSPASEASAPWTLAHRETLGAGGASPAKPSPGPEPSRGRPYDSREPNGAEEWRSRQKTERASEYSAVPSPELTEEADSDSECSHAGSDWSCSGSEGDPDAGAAVVSACHGDCTLGDDDFQKVLQCINGGGA